MCCEARALLGSCDSLTLTRLLAVRSLTAGILHHLASDPPASVLRTLQLLASRVLAPDSTVPARMHAEPFSDAALQQLAEAVSQLGELAEGQAEQEGEGGPGGQPCHSRWVGMER